MKEQKCNRLINALETNLVEYYNKKNKNTFRPKEDLPIRGSVTSIIKTRSRDAPDGYYIYTINEGKESHGITIIKDTNKKTGEIKFCKQKNFE